ncbi:hypothetical protein SBV1_620034 [Verrucomicrobia bacterium]|nr:hypothetical protein SBV1_620034 [Verrucomicrobiota bacterium]
MYLQSRLVYYLFVGFPLCLRLTLHIGLQHTDATRPNSILS